MSQNLNDQVVHAQRLSIYSGIEPRVVAIFFVFCSRTNTTVSPHIGLYIRNVNLTYIRKPKRLSKTEHNRGTTITEQRNKCFHFSQIVGIN